MALKVDSFFGLIGGEVRDEYDRIIGTLVSFSSNVEGYIQSVEIKLVDRGLERVEGDRVRLIDGKIVVSPQWKYEALRVIESLERAYKRRKAVENIAKQSSIPSEIVEAMKRQLSEEIKKLRIKAEDVKSKIKSRINEIDDEMLHVASAIANLQMLYFSGEISDKSYTSGMNHLRKLNEALEKEKRDAKNVLDKLEKTHEAATGVLEGSGIESRKPAAIKPAPQTSQSVKQPPGRDGEILVKIEEG